MLVSRSEGEGSGGKGRKEGREGKGREGKGGEKRTRLLHISLRGNHIFFLHTAKIHIKYEIII